VAETADGGERARLTRAPIDPAAALAVVAAPSAGATVLFLGTVRDRHDGRAVVAIDYSGYESMAERLLARIEAELEAATPGLRVAIVHRLGALAVGDASIAIAASSPRRAAAQEAAKTALERVKREAPIWKRERYADGTEAWREEEPLRSD
jgi:molybdopterin synthase catalytic subunit